MADSIRRVINRGDFTLDRDDDLFAEVNCSENIAFHEVVDLLREHREGPGGSAPAHG